LGLGVRFADPVLGLWGVRFADPVLGLWGVRFADSVLGLWGVCFAFAAALALPASAAAFFRAAAALRDLTAAAVFFRATVRAFFLASRVSRNFFTFSSAIFLISLLILSDISCYIHIFFFIIYTTA
jgi:hypothetical protein